MTRLVAALLALLCVAACKDSTAPAPPDLTGTWSGSVNSLTFTVALSDVDQQLSGTGTIAGPADTLTVHVAGSHRHPNFAMSFSLTGFEPAAYAGIVRSASRMEGLITGSGFVADSLILTRQ